MTTAVTLETHGWPVKVTIVDRYTQNLGIEGAEQHVVATMEEVVPPNTMRVFHATSTRSIAFDELPLPT